MPAFNASVTITTSIEAILSQDIKSFELIIVDDASNDDTFIKMSQYKDARIRLFRNTSNQGVGYSRKLALSKARGVWIAFCDADDVWHKNHLQNHLDIITKVDGRFFHASYFAGYRYPYVKRKISAPQVVTARGLLQCNYIGCSTVILKNAENISNFYPEHRRRQDWIFWYWYMTRFNCSAILIDSYSVYYLLNDSGLSKNKKVGLFFDTISFYESCGYNKEVSCLLSFRFILFQIWKKYRYQGKSNAIWG